MGLYLLVREKEPKSKPPASSYELEMEFAETELPMGNIPPQRRFFNKGFRIFLISTVFFPDISRPTPKKRSAGCRAFAVKVYYEIDNDGADHTRGGGA